jgi:hypothetical protein
LRALPAIAATAALCAATRRRSPRWFGIAAALTALSFFVSLDFAVYATVPLLIAIFRSGALRRRVISSVAIGGASLALFAFALLAMAGSLTAFFRVTLTEILPMAPAYAIGFFTLPGRYADFAGFPDGVALLAVPNGIWLVGWIVICVGAAVMLARSSRAHRRTEPLLVLAMFTVASAVAYSERFNRPFLLILPAIIATSAFILLRRRQQLVAIALVVLAVILAHPNVYLTRNFDRLAAAETKQGVPITFLRRAAGAEYHLENARSVALFTTMVQEELKEGETFFDFASMPALYYLLEKPCPIRQYEVPLFETEKLQREVIARLERDRSVRLALMDFPNRGEAPIDGVPSSVRAPLVDAYLRAHFRPRFDAQGVTVWRRID